MSDTSSEHSRALAEQLRETALKNLGRSGPHRSAISGRFITPGYASRNPGTTTTETTGGSSTTSRSTERLSRKSRKP